MTFTKEQYEALKKAHSEAVSKDLPMFIFEGSEYVTK